MRIYSVLITIWAVAGCTPLPPSAKEAPSNKQALPVGHARNAISRIRKGWLQNEFKNLEKAVRDAFAPWNLPYVRHVSEVEVGDHMESNNGEDFEKFKPGTRLGGKRDLLSEDVFDALDDGDGIVYIDWEDPVLPDPGKTLPPLGYCLIFTLPSGDEWSSYVVIGLDPETPGWRPHPR